jgi:hypothetical protein
MSKDYRIKYDAKRDNYWIYESDSAPTPPKPSFWNRYNKNYYENYHKENDWSFIENPIFATQEEAMKRIEELIKNPHAKHDSIVYEYIRGKTVLPGPIQNQKLINNIVKAAVEN